MNVNNTYKVLTFTSFASLKIRWGREAGQSWFSSRINKYLQKSRASYSLYILFIKNIVKCTTKYCVVTAITLAYMTNLRIYVITFYMLMLFFSIVDPKHYGKFSSLNVLWLAPVKGERGVKKKRAKTQDQIVKSQIWIVLLSALKTPGINLKTLKRVNHEHAKSHRINMENVPMPTFNSEISELRCVLCW